MNRKTILMVVIGMLILYASLATSTGSSENKPLMFDHHLHVVDAELMCTDCHINVESTGVGERATAGHDQCESCHEMQDEADCATCHSDPDDPQGSLPIAGLYEGFDHSAHVENGITCDACHGDVDALKTDVPVPNMEECQSCHRTAGATLECASCHAGGSPLPEDHAHVSWSNDHGLDAAFGTTTCEMCHEQSSCDECHQGTLLDGAPHPAGWMFDHFAEAAFGQECLTCHETREWCTNCHRTMVPIPHGFGPEFANRDDGGEHKSDAEAFGETCLSCHDVGGEDPTCARCHG